MNEVIPEIILCTNIYEHILNTWIFQKSWKWRSHWQLLFKAHCHRALSLSPMSATDENKSTKTWSAWGGEVADLSKEKGPEPFPPWAFIRFILHRNSDKAHQHFQAVRVKQYLTYRELWGLILSYGQLVKGYKTLGDRLIPALDPYHLGWGYKQSRFHRIFCILS